MGGNRFLEVGDLFALARKKDMRFMIDSGSFFEISDLSVLFESVFPLWQVQVEEMVVQIWVLNHPCPLHLGGERVLFALSRKKEPKTPWLLGSCAGMPTNSCESPFAFRKKGLGKEGLVLKARIPGDGRARYELSMNAPFAP
jgi:hypothetical protein